MTSCRWSVYPLRSNGLATSREFFIFPAVVGGKLVELGFECFPPAATINRAIDRFFVQLRFIDFTPDFGDSCDLSRWVDRRVIDS